MKKKKEKTKGYLIGITGGIGAGKSTVSRVFSAAGYPVLSADLLSREVVAPGMPALREITALFGREALLPDGSLDRAFVRRAIVGDSGLRLQLEAITHPRIQALTQEKASALFRAGKRIVFYEAPLLFEAKSDHGMDKVITVHAPDELRIARVLARDKYSRAEAEGLLKSQMPQEEKRRRADYCLENAGSERALEQRALELLAEIEKDLA